MGLPRESTEFVSSESSSETEILSSSIFKYTALRFQRVRVLNNLKALERKAIDGHCLLQAALYRTVPYHCRVRYGRDFLKTYGTVPTPPIIKKKTSLELRVEFGIHIFRYIFGI